MKKGDLLRMCVDNLLRRKARTFLSILGVIIGCCAILLMLSIGVGLSRSNEAWLEDMGALNQIDVYASYGGSQESKINDSAIRSMRQIEHVQSVIPKYSADDFNMTIYCGDNNRYRASWASIVGIETDLMEETGYVVKEGEAPNKSGEVLMGDYFEYDMIDSRRPDGHNQIEYYMYDPESDEMPDPYVSLLGKDVTVAFKDEQDHEVYSVTLHVVGKLEQDYNAGYETIDGLVFRAEDLQHLTDDAAKAMGKKKKPLKVSELKIIADDIDNVAAIEQAIQDMGFGTSSMESMRESTQKESATIQLVLGGIGAVSLIVAAIGIINTMIMSVSERTKEIGVMKAIGCFVSDIRELFLMEAAAIGLVGGVVGALLSFIISCIINLVGSGLMVQYDTGETYTVFEKMFTAPTRVSVIPLWLYVFGLLFSTIVGLLAGFYPANKAVKISALEAMHNE